eukprot:3352074-Alexandrium_andersonii.AAC.1
MGHLPIAETPRMEAIPSPHRPFRALSGPPLDERCAMGEDAFTATWGAAKRRPSCPVIALSGT